MNNSENLYGIAHAGRSVTFQFQDPTDYIAKKIIESKVFYELDVLEEISRLGVGDGLFVDAGANIGNHSLFFSIILDREVAAFEPAEEAFSQLIRNIRLNRAEGLVSCHRMALGAESGRGYMKIVAGNLGASSFSHDADGGVELETLDSVLYERKQPIALIKIDVEGLEVDVLQGAVKILGRDMPLLIVEGQTSFAFGKISEFLAGQEYVPVSMRGVTPTYFFVHRSRLGELQERSIFYIRHDVDHNRRILQGYLARIESNLRGVLTKAEFEKLSAAMDTRQKDLLSALSSSETSAPNHFDAMADDIKSAVRGLLSEHGQRAQMLSDVLEHRFRLLSTELEQDRESRAKSFDAMTGDFKSAVGGLLGEQGQRTQLLADVLEHKFRVLSSELEQDRLSRTTSFNDLQQRLQDSNAQIVKGVVAAGEERAARVDALAEQVLSGLSLQIQEREQQQDVMRVIENSITEGTGKLASAIEDMASTLSTDQAERVAVSAQQLALLERHELSMRSMAGSVNTRLESLVAEMSGLADSVALNVAELAAGDSARRQTFLEGHEKSVRDLADVLETEMKTLEARFSSVAESLPAELADLLKIDASRNYAVLRRQEDAVRLLGSSVTNRMDSLEMDLARVGSVVAKEAFPKVLHQLKELESHISTGIASKMNGIQASLKAVETLREDGRRALALKEKELERALLESDRLQNEVNRLVVAVQTERARARYAGRRLNVLYTTGVRATVGKMRKLVSPLTFGLLKPYETWPAFEKRMEARVVREVQDFKKLHANSLRRPSATVVEQQDEDSQLLQPASVAVSPTSSMNAMKHRDHVRIGIASIEIRRTALSRVIDCLYDQADEILVYLNDYSEVPKFLNREKIQVVHQKGDVGDRGKFYDIDNFSGYFFSCDDDIEYPPYYVQHCIDAIERYGRKAVVGWHGSLLKTPFIDYYSSESRRVFSFRSGRPEDIAVHILGTGCSSFHTDTIDVRYADFLTPNMADVYFALLGQKQRVPFVVIKHDPAEALPLDIPDDKPIHRESMQKTGSRADTREIQNRCVKDWQDWRAEKPAPVHFRASYTIAYVGRVDADRWKKGGILKSGGLITQALRALGHRVVDVEISQAFDAIAEQAKPADIVWIYPGDPERPDFAPVEALIDKVAKAGKQVYVNLSYNLIESRTQWIQAKLKTWNSSYGNRVKACLFTYAAMSDPGFEAIRSNLICIPKSIDFSSDIRASFEQTEGIFLGDLQKLLNRNLVNGDIEDWIAALRKALPGVTLYAVRQYGGKIDRELGLTVLPYTHGRAWEEWLAAKRIVCCLTPHATYEMIPVEAGGLGVPTIYRPMPQSHSENLSTAGIQVHTPEEFAAACSALYYDYTLWSMYSRAASARARSAHISHVAASLHVQLALGRV